MRLAREGKVIVLPLFLIFGLLIFLWSQFIISINLPLIFIVLLIFCLNFFRDPKRIIPKEENIIIAPADGKIVKKEIINDSQLGEMQLVSIFLNVFNVHVNRMPINGVFKKVKYEKGSFLAAFDHRASDENERVEVTIESEIGRLKVKQIAGLIARRIICYAQKNNSMEIGGRLGFIRFGSRTDLILPKDVKLSIELGQKVIGNETVIGTYEKNNNG